MRIAMFVALAGLAATAACTPLQQRSAQPAAAPATAAPAPRAPRSTPTTQQTTTPAQAPRPVVIIPEGGGDRGGGWGG